MNQTEQTLPNFNQHQQFQVIIQFLIWVFTPDSIFDQFGNYRLAVVREYDAGIGLNLKLLMLVEIR